MSGTGHKKKILVTGANGQLGKELQDLAPVWPQFEFTFLSREDLPIHHFELVRHFFEVLRPDWLINCAAYTAVDRAETEKDLAFQVNGEAVGVLAAVCRERGAHFLHISTDYVFDGTAHHPYRPTDPTNPQSVYGASKLEGEKEALQLNHQSLIIRTSWVYSSHGKNFVRTMLRLFAERDEVKVVNDQTGSPTYAADLADAILQIVSRDFFLPGIYHYANKGVITWYDLAVAIRDITGSTCRVTPIPTSDYPTPARRPAWSVLDTSQLEMAYGIQPPDWRTSLKRCLEKLT
jgi:dTDP-4-dehydrorhamnose reductase